PPQPTAMLNDLLTIDEEKVTYESENNKGVKETKDVLLNENDDLWCELRHMHIADVITLLSDRIREFVGTNGGAQLAQNSGNDMSLTEMATALKQLPEYRETMAKLSQHMHLAHKCMDVFGKLGLLELSEIEQTLATGTDADGKAPKAKALVDNLIDTLAGVTSRESAIRLIMIYIISQQGITEDDRRRLFSAAGLNESEQSKILNLEKMGVTLQQSKAPSKSFSSMFRSKRVKSTGRADKDSEYAMSRYVSNFKGLIEQLVEDKLSIEDYPSILPLPEGGGSSSMGSARSVRRGKDSGGDSKASNSRWGGTSAAESSNSTNPKDLANRKFTGGRQIVFQVGGVSHSEIRAGYEVMAGNKGGKEVIVGSTSFIKPAEYLDYVGSLS
ncbi:hypothetical protein TrLO_g7265, partial [Triparma laevis f. longispina]